VTSSSVECPTCRATTWSGDELSNFSETCRRSKSKTGLCVKLYATSAMGDSNFHRQIKLLLVCSPGISLIRNQLSYTVRMHTIGFIMRRSYKIALHKVLLSGVDCEMLVTTSVSCPSCWKCANTIVYTVIYSSVANNIQRRHICTLRACFIAIYVCRVKIRLYDLQKSLQRHKKLSHSADNFVRFCKTFLGVNYPVPHCRPEG